MNRFAVWSLVLLPGMLHAGEAGVSIDQRINQVVQPLTDFVTSIVFAAIPVGSVGIPFVLLWLIAAATIFTVFFRFVNLRAMRHSLQLIRGDYDDPWAAGEVTHFQALATALSGTVGLGNIAGVAIAVSMGGPGATFWMILAGFLGMSTKFVECTLGVKYRHENADGSVSGGPMYYLSRGLAERSVRLKKLGKVLAAMFAVFCIGGAFGGNMFQSNQSFNQLVAVTGGESSWLADNGWVYGLVFAMLVGLVIIGGIKSIARVTSKLVPFMAITYVASGLAVVGMNINLVGDAFGQIVSGAFSPEGITGGFMGVLIQGFRRAAFSNEAGIGSAAIAHSAVRTNLPITEGLVALYEPFVDTVVVCTITALVIITTGSYDPTGAVDGVALTSRAFASQIDWFPYLLTLAVELFAYSTIIAWSYYGLKSWTYLFGETRTTEVVFKLLFLSFVIFGSAMKLGAVVDFADAMIIAMAFPNVVGLYFLAPVVRREFLEYWQRYKSGTLPWYVDHVGKESDVGTVARYEGASD